MLELYLKTAVWFRATDGRSMQTLPGRENSGATLSEQLFGNSLDVWIITAQNPESAGALLGDNGVEIMLRLESDLINYDIHFERVECGSPDRTHLEKSLALQTKTDSDVDFIRDLARKYMQNAVFRFRGERQQVVSTIGQEFTGETVYEVNDSREDTFD